MCRVLCGYHPTFWAETTLFWGSSQLMTKHEKGTRAWAFLPNTKLPQWAVLAPELGQDFVRSALRSAALPASLSPPLLSFTSHSLQSATCTSNSFSVSASWKTQLTSSTSKINPPNSLHYHNLQAPIPLTWMAAWPLVCLSASSPIATQPSLRTTTRKIFYKHKPCDVTSPA